MSSKKLFISGTSLNILSCIVGAPIQITLVVPTERNIFTNISIVFSVKKYWDSLLDS